MKLLYVVNQINGTTGLERILAIKANYFIKEFNYDIVMVTLNEVEETPFFDLNESIKIIRLPNKSNPLSHITQFGKINKILKQESPDTVIICIDNIFGLYLPAFLKKKYTYVYERHNSKRVNLGQGATSFKAKVLNGIKKKLLDRGGKHYDTVVLLSDDHLAEWSHLKNLKVINNPLIFYPETYAKLENKRVLAVGRHTHQKGFDMLMKSWAKVVEKHKDWKLDVYGKKDHDSSYMDLAKAYGITDYVTFHDPVPNIMEVYLESSIYALSSRYEGFPLVLIETMACGVPAVAFNCPCGVKELITHGEDGLHVPVDDTDEFAKSLIYLIENQEIRTKMGAKARKNILRLSPENIFPQWKNLFEQLSA
ncbi:glycosyltransferase family 4 protein [Hyunsoonleella rubra]|uniref:Glycosyltransferase family 4 protein n=1 Tax=Hyunsoonleella rubra TaxID=1737062 RepID=A0ABW5T998_9FLAO